jgi:hypothetical protein
LAGAAVGAGLAGAAGIDGGRITGALDGGRITGALDGGRITGALDGGRITGALDGGRIAGALDGGRIAGADGTVGRATAPPVVRMVGTDTGAFPAELIDPKPERDELDVPDGGLRALEGCAPPPATGARPDIAPFTVVFLLITFVLELFTLFTVLFIYVLLTLVWFT